MRMGVLESPVFARAQGSRRGRARAGPAVIKENWREMCCRRCCGPDSSCRTTCSRPTSSATAPASSGFGRATMLACLSLRSLTSIVMIPSAGHMSDIYGRKKIVAIGLVGIGSVLVRVLSDAGRRRRVSLVFLAMVIDSVLQDLQYAPQAALIAENFPASRRYSGSGLGLSPGVDHRRRSGADHRHVAVPAVPVAVRHCRVRPGQRAHQPGDAAGVKDTRRPGSHVSSGSDGCQMGVRHPSDTI